MNIRIGLFDSGVGGFTVLKKILQFYPQFPCVYLADTARLPYGNRSQKEIREIADEVLGWLIGQDLSAIIVACNTTNSLALDVLVKNLNVPTFGLIDSGVQMIWEKRIGVLATSATVTSKAYTKKILSLKPNSFVLEQACPAFVPMIEMGQFNSLEIRNIAHEYLKPLLKSKVEAIILGCSHYPLLLPLFKELLPDNVRIIDPAIGLARNLDNLIKNENQICENLVDYSNTRFFVTSDPGGFASRAMYWLNNYPEVELISLRSKARVF